MANTKENKKTYRSKSEIEADFNMIRKIVEKIESISTFKEVADVYNSETGKTVSSAWINRSLSIAGHPIVEKRLRALMDERKIKKVDLDEQDEIIADTTKPVEKEEKDEPNETEIPNAIIIDCSAVNKVGFFDFLSSCIINGTKIFSCNVTEYELTKLSAGKDSSFDSKCANRLIRYYTLHSESFEHLDGPKPENGNEERDQQILDFAAEMNLTIVTGDINMAFKALSRGIKFKPFYQNISSKTPKKNVVSFKPVRVNPDSKTMEFDAQPGKFRKITVNEHVLTNPENVTLRLHDIIIISTIKSDYNTIAVFKIKAIGTVNNAFLSFSCRYQKKEELPDEYRSYAL